MITTKWTCDRNGNWILIPAILERVGDKWRDRFPVQESKGRAA